MGANKATNGLLQFSLDNKTHTIKLTDPMLRDCLAALAPYQRPTKDGKERTSSRRLNEQESKRAYLMHEQGMTQQQIAVLLCCSVLSVRNAINRVKSGRYGEVPA